MILRLIGCEINLILHIMPMLYILYNNIGINVDTPNDIFIFI